VSYDPRTASIRRFADPELLDEREADELARRLLAAAAGGDAEAMQVLLAATALPDRALVAGTALYFLGPDLLMATAPALGLTLPVSVRPLLELAARHRCDARPLVTAWRSRLPPDAIREALVHAYPMGPELLSYLSLV
jgi:hypothetical protein